MEGPGSPQDEHGDFFLLPHSLLISTLLSSEGRCLAKVSETFNLKFSEATRNSRGSSIPFFGLNYVSLEFLC